MSGKIFKRAIATLTLASLPIIGLAGTANASSLYSRFCGNAGYGVKVACSKVGHGEYVWGGNGPWAFDCSGLTKYAVRHGDGRYIPRTAQDQKNYTRHIRWGAEKPGDLVFFDEGGYVDHVGMFVGFYDGHPYMIAASYPHYGQHYLDIRIEQIDSSYWLNRASISFGRV
jgi:cell wall-associated NlpC family hydrolase